MRGAFRQAFQPNALGGQKIDVSLEAEKIERRPVGGKLVYLCINTLGIRKRHAIDAQVTGQ